MATSGWIFIIIFSKVSDKLIAIEKIAYNVRHVCWWRKHNFPWLIFDKLWHCYYFLPFRYLKQKKNQTIFMYVDITSKIFLEIFATFFIFLYRYRIKKFNDLMKLWIDDLCQYNSEEENMTFLCLRTNSFTLTSFRSI